MKLNFANIDYLHQHAVEAQENLIASLGPLPDEWLASKRQHFCLGNATRLELHAAIEKAFAEQDALGIACLGNYCISKCPAPVLDFIYDNYYTIREMGIYEEVLYHAYTYLSGEPNHQVIAELFRVANKATLQSFSQTNHCLGFPVTVYRGVAYEGQKVDGVSWTANKRIACWYAGMSYQEEFAKLYATILTEPHVYLYTNDRNEEEFVINTKGLNIEPVQISVGEMKKLAGEIPRNQLEMPS